MKTVVLFPDYQARGFVDFSHRILSVVPDATVVAMLNGLPVNALLRLVHFTHGLPPTVHPIIAENATGLLSTLVSGYTTVLNRFTYDESDMCVVRLDTAEHPPEAIPMLAQAAMDCNGMAIGDLAFDERTLREESIDQFAHLDAFPTLFRQMTGGRLSLSCAHGFQAFAPNRLSHIFSEARELTALVSRLTGQPLEWGFDGAMALAAAGLGRNIIIRSVQATERRDRPREKVALQFERALQMCLAARKLYPQFAR